MENGPFDSLPEGIFRCQVVDLPGISPCTFAVMVTTPFVAARRNAGNVEGRREGQGDR